MRLHNKTLVQIVKDKEVLFITTKNIDYIRNTQELKILREIAKNVNVISSSKKNYVFRVLSVWKKITKKVVTKNDVVFVGFSPQFVIPFLGKKFIGKIVIIDFFISFYDTLVFDRKKIQEKGLVAKICHLIDERTLERADYVITDTKAHAEYFISEFHGNPSLFDTIYLEADPHIYYPRIQEKSADLIEKFVVLYFGSILPLQGVDVVLDAVRRLKEHTEIFFDIIGPIPSKYDKPIQNNVCYTNWLSQEMLAEHIANADICLAGHFCADIEKAKRTIPGKAFIYEMMKKPMILGDGVANHEFFQEDNNHNFVKMGDGKGLALKIIELQQKSFN